MIQYVLKKNINEKMPNAYGKFFAYPVITQTYDIDQLVDHMASHNTPFSRGALKGMLTDMVACIRELVLQGIAVKIADLAIISIGIKNVSIRSTPYCISQNNIVTLHGGIIFLILRQEYEV